jgi:hypothetical protein
MDEAMQDAVCELRRIILLRTPVNKGPRRGPEPINSGPIIAAYHFSVL